MAAPLPTATRVAACSLTGKRWELRDEGGTGETLTAMLARSRGIDLGESASWAALASPLTLGDMEEAVARIRRALHARETIGIIGDYDADGITGVAQLVRFFRRHGTEPVVILPHRERDGYGVKHAFIERLAEASATLLLTVDTGIAANAEIAEARRQGMEVIVTDHHSALTALPRAILVHPTVRNRHANPHASGAGVVFTLLRALEEEPWEDWGTDAALAAVGTVADVVPLTGENRMIVRLGLEAMNRGGAAPLMSLARSVVGEGEKLTSAHIGYRIAPRINAAGRLADPLLSLQALLEGGSAIAELTALNVRRQDMTEDMLEEALGMVEGEAPLLAALSPDFHPGIVGLIAGRLTERFGKPSVIGMERGGIVTCSLRSIPEYDIAAALGRTSEHLLTFGGHSAAGGCTLELEAWPAFTQALLEDAGGVFGDRLLFPTLTLDAAIDPSNVTLALAKELAVLEPFGEGNREPRFLIRHQTLISARRIGNEGRHLQCSVRGVRAVGFGLGHLLPSLSGPLDLACRLSVNRWQERESAELVIEDIAAASLT